MKIAKLITLFLALMLGLVALTACDEKATVQKVSRDENGNLILFYEDGTTQIVDSFKTMVGAELNADMHLIIKYSDGTTEDKGYYGPAACSVTFKDYDGTVLATVKTYQGLDVTAPANPVREDYIFKGWDKDLTKVAGDMTVTAMYDAEATYTVVFKDYNGIILKTETVVKGKDATPPANPTRPDYNFAGWKGDYTGVTANVEIIAEYTEKGSYTVTFVDYNGLELGTDTVKEGKTATAPMTPTRDGYTFKSWSSSLSNITAHKTVTAQYTLVQAKNVFDIAYKISGSNVTVTLSLAGDVCLAGFEGTLAFEGLTATSVTANSANVLANLKSDGTVSFAYTSATNVTKGETVFTVTLTKSNKDTAKAELTLIECFDQDFEDASYKIIGESIKLK